MQLEKGKVYFGTSQNPQGVLGPLGQWQQAASAANYQTYRSGANVALTRGVGGSWQICLIWSEGSGVVPAELSLVGPAADPRISSWLDGWKRISDDESTKSAFPWVPVGIVAGLLLVAGIAFGRKKR